MNTGVDRKGGTYRFREFRITPDCEPDAEPWQFAMECAVCEDSSPSSEDVQQPQQWAIAHLKQRPEHLTYREHITRPYRAEPGRWL